MPRQALMAAEDDVDEGCHVGNSDLAVAVDVGHAACGSRSLAEDDVDESSDIGDGDLAVAVDIATLGGILIGEVTRSTWGVDAGVEGVHTV